jgi:hypothetical protein
MQIIPLEIMPVMHDNRNMVKNFANQKNNQQLEGLCKGLYAGP